MAKKIGKKRNRSGEKRGERRGDQRGAQGAGKKASGLGTGGIRYSIYDMTEEKLVVIKTG